MAALDFLRQYDDVDHNGTRVVKTLRNAGKSWTPDDVETLEKLAAEEKPVRVIALLMGRTALAVQAKALQEHILLKRQSRSAEDRIPR